MQITNKKYPNLNLANEEDRGENLIIDFIISSVVGILVALVTFQSYSIAILIYLSIRFLYYLIFELITGRTPGKYQTITKVVNEEGNSPTTIQIIIRSVSRFFSILSGISDDERAVHDILSNTFVIKDYSLKKIEIRQPLIFIFNQSLLGILIYYFISEPKLETFEGIALTVLIIAFVSGLIYGIKKINFLLHQNTTQLHQRKIL